MTERSVDAPRTTALQRARKGLRCPGCGEGRLLPLLFGMPAGEAILAAARGEIVLGGCVVSSAPGAPEPRYACPACERQFA